MQVEKCIWNPPSLNLKFNAQFNVHLSTLQLPLTLWKYIVHKLCARICSLLVFAHHTSPMFFLCSPSFSFGLNDLPLSHTGFCGLLLTRTASWIQEQRHHHPGEPTIALLLQAHMGLIKFGDGKINVVSTCYETSQTGTLFIYVTNVFVLFVYPSECSAIFCCNQDE